jgi:hypothetical protein
VSTNDIARVEPPSLPINGDLGTLVSILRLFFRRLTGVVLNLTASDTLGGKFIHMPTGAFVGTSTQTAALTDTAYPVAFNSNELINGIGIENDDEVHVENPGYYSVHVTLQADAPSGTGGELTVWLEVSGTEQAYSCRQYELTGLVSLECCFPVSLEADDYIQIMWAKNNADIQLAAVASTGLHPAVPAAAITVNFLSNSQ